jgi:GntR family transcriptional repressor for pyruvate dehydrogenase complex
VTDEKKVPERRLRPEAALPVQRIRPAYEQVAEQLRELVLSGQVTPGDRLPVEGDLSAEFGVSRSTIREAIRLLSSQSLVHTVRGPAGGTFVSAADPDALRDYLVTSIGLLGGGDSVSVTDLLEVREALEVPAAHLAALHRREEHLVTMRDAIEREREQTVRGAQFRHNQQFHVHLLEASNNQLLAAVTEPVFRVIQTRFLKDEDEAFYAQVSDEHSEILAAIEAGDGQGAAQAMHRHLNQLRGVYGQPPSGVSRPPSVAAGDT